MQHLIGKVISVKAPIGRDEWGNEDGSIVEIRGVCEYIGPNEILGIPLQVTISRMPIEVKHINDIKCI